MEDKVVLKIVQVSDTHLNGYRDLLTPMIESINNERPNLVVVTGDLVDRPDEKLYDLAESILNRLTSRIIVIPGEYDYGPHWVKHFGDRYRSLSLSDFEMDFMDTSFMGNRFASGWANYINKEDPEQARWLVERLKKGKHIIFSHHPIDNKENNEFLVDNVRAVFAGHLHSIMKVGFKYKNPTDVLKEGYMVVPAKFHGNSTYFIFLVMESGKIIGAPKSVISKKTAW